MSTDTSAMRTIHPDALHRWVNDVFLAASSSATEARLTADHLVLSNLSGHDSHGVGMVPRYVKAIAAGELQMQRIIAQWMSASPPPQ